MSTGKLIWGSNILRRVFEQAEYILALVAGLSVLSMMLVTSYDVVMRYLFDRPTAWALDVSTYFVIVCVFLALAYVLKVEGHIRMEMVLRRFGPKTQTILLLITLFLSLIFFVVLTWKGAEMTWLSIQRWELSLGTAELPLFPVKLMIPLGSLFLSLRIVVKICRYVAFLRSRSPEEKAEVV